MPIFRSLKTKFVFGLSLLLILIFIGPILSNILSIRTRLRNSANQEVKAFSQLASRTFIEAYSRYYPSGFGKLKEIVYDIWELSPNISRIRLVDMEGRVRLDTEDLAIKELAGLDTITSSILEKARKPDSSFIYKDGKEGIIDQIIYPFIDEWGRHEYSLIYSVSYSIIEKEITQTIIRTALGTVILLVLSIALVNLLILQITKPLAELEEGTKIVGKGNLGYRLKVKTGDEIEQLADEFNKMTERLNESMSKLEEAKESLEVKVHERTKELQKRIDELEKFHKVTVGRELKMMELKDEVERLKEELEKCQKNK